MSADWQVAYSMYSSASFVECQSKANTHRCKEIQKQVFSNILTTI